MKKTLFAGYSCTLLFGSSLITPYMAERTQPHTQNVNDPGAHREAIKREEEERRAARRISLRSKQGRMRRRGQVGDQSVVADAVPSDWLTRKISG